MNKLVFNIVTFIPEGKELPRIFDNPKIFELSKKYPVNIFINSDASDEVEFKLLNELNKDSCTVTSGGSHKPLGYCRNELLKLALKQGATHVMNVDDDDFISDPDSLMAVINKVPDKFIYTQRIRNNKSFFPSIISDSGSNILHGKFIANAYNCMVMPMHLLVKHRISFPEFLDTLEDNCFYAKLMMNYNGDFVLMANPIYHQKTHEVGEFSMTTRTKNLMTEEIRYLDFLAKFDSYLPNFSKIVECHDGHTVYELNKDELNKFERSFNGEIPEGDTLHFVFGNLTKLEGELIKTEGVIEFSHGTHLSQVARIVKMSEFLKYNSYYTTYRLFSKFDGRLSHYRDAIRARYFDKTPIPQEILDTNIIMLTSWNSL